MEPLKTPIVEHAYRCPYCLVSFNNEDGALKCIAAHEMSSTITKIYEDGVAYGHEKLSGKIRFGMEIITVVLSMSWWGWAPKPRLPAIRSFTGNPSSSSPLPKGPSSTAPKKPK